METESVEVKPTTSNRNANQKKRTENFRKKSNVNKISDVKRNIDQQLHPEYALLNATISSIQVAEQKQAVRFNVTTRGIGLVISLLQQRIHAQLPTINIPLNAWYRVTLAQLEAKMYDAYKNQPLPVNVMAAPLSTLTADQRAVIGTIAVNFSPLAIIINSLGNVVINDVTYYPQFSGGILSPIFTNLRAYCVLAAADENVVYFPYASFPGGQWAENVLANPDAIIPDAYTTRQLHDDITVVKSFYASVTKKLPKYSGSVNFNPNGSPSQLVSSDVTAARATCTFDGETCVIHGDSSNYASLRVLNQRDFVIGMASLFGEFVYQVPAQLLQREDEPRGQTVAPRTFNSDWENIISSMIA